MKRKRSNHRSKETKRPKLGHQSHESQRESVDFHHPVLSCYYDTCKSLRQYFGIQLKKIDCDSLSNDDSFNTFLDGTIVGKLETQEIHGRLNHYERTAFAKLVKTYRPESTIDPEKLYLWSLKDIVNFVIWMQFRHQTRPQHLLCQGFEKEPRFDDRLDLEPISMVGVRTIFKNEYVQMLTGSCWNLLYAMLGVNGAFSMIELLTKCAIFCTTNENCYQISGLPLSNRVMDKKALVERAEASERPQKRVPSKSVLRKPSEIRFVRSRILYGRSTLNAQGKIRLGLRHIHILNRLRKLEQKEETIRFAQYVFPLQFKLHNVFSSTVSKSETAHSFRDYTLRETDLLSSDSGPNKVPKRLRGVIFDMLYRFRHAHSRLSYVELLNHHCPVQQARNESNGGPEENAPTTQATSPMHVFLFCKSVMNHLVGPTNLGTNNWRAFLSHLRRFVFLRRFENMSLGETLEGIKVTEIPWLSLPNLSNEKMSKSDFDKRKELLAEFIYYLYDSIIIPLIKSCFRVTESSADKNKLFYFRLDVWHEMSESALNKIKLESFEEMTLESAKKRLSGRSLTYSHVRLLPKSKGFRPITNLRRRPMVKVNGRRVMGHAINSLLTPAYNILRYEKNQNLDQPQGALFSVSGIQDTLKSFQSRLASLGKQHGPFYFAKVDVKACFDSIPADKVLEMTKTMLYHSEYSLYRHAHIGKPAIIERSNRPPVIKSRIKFGTEGAAIDEPPNWVEQSDRLGQVFVGPISQRQQKSRESVLYLLEEHLLGNIVKIGRKFYRQKVGIPQGSVVSSMLCTLFYNQLEKADLEFINRPDTCLLRLIDDFMVITTDRSTAEQFLQVMHRGIPAFGISVNPSKSSVNFDVCVNGVAVSKSPSSRFAYCGIAIDTLNLSVSKDVNRLDPSSIPSSLTVETSTLPGISFHQKSINALRIHLQPMLFNLRLTKLPTVLLNICMVSRYATYRLWHYSQALLKNKRPHAALITRTINDLISLLASHVHRANGKKTTIRISWVRFLALQATQSVFGSRSSGYKQVLVWIAKELELVKPKGKLARRLVYEAMRDGIA